jgi:proteasome lid subunit RPN8/RPN11
VLDEVGAHARLAVPHECCGLLLGTSHEILDAVRSPNLADDPTRRFLIDPAVHFDARRRARDRGLVLVGFYHSHPNSAPVPSTADLEGATYADHWYLIVRPSAEGAEARLFRLDGSRMVEEAVAIVDDV